MVNMLSLGKCSKATKSLSRLRTCQRALAISPRMRLKSPRAEHCLFQKKVSIRNSDVASSPLSIGFADCLVFREDVHQIGFPVLVKVGLGIMVVGGVVLYVKNRSGNRKASRSRQTLP